MKSTSTRFLFSLAIGSVVAGLVLAGNLEPPGPPNPTMFTLQQLYDKLCAPADVARTGQTECWDASGTSIPCAGTGQDGEFHKGATVAPRFTDNADGTVRDNLTGLVWLKNANCFGAQTWTNALASANTLAGGSCGLTDGSVAGNWRLPSIQELPTLFDYGSWNPALPVGHPFSGVQFLYWSSTTVPSSASYAWTGSAGTGGVSSVAKTSAFPAWPVRGGL